MLNLKLLFGGGSEVLVDGRREIAVTINENEKLTIAELLDWVLKNLLNKCSRPELLITNGNVRPGILVLINDVDWEILGGLKATIKNNDSVTFISTLHGG